MIVQRSVAGRRISRAKVCGSASRCPCSPSREARSTVRRSLQPPMTRPGNGRMSITLPCSQIRDLATSRNKGLSLSRNWSMHILVTADTLGGVWTYTRELVTGLVRRGPRVTLVSFGDIPTAAQTRWMEGLENFDYRPTAFKLEWMLDSETDMLASAQYLETDRKSVV